MVLMERKRCPIENHDYFPMMMKIMDSFDGSR
jgi:hypothetical protein